MRGFKAALLTVAIALMLLPAMGCSEERSTMEQTGQIPRQQTEPSPERPTVPEVDEQTRPAPHEQAGRSPIEPAPSLPRGMERGTPRMQCEEQFAAMDSDKDGRVTQEEFMAFPHRAEVDREATFQLLDVDNDGILTKEEFCMERGPRRMQPGTEPGEPKIIQ